MPTDKPTPAEQLQVAQAAFVAGLMHGTLRAGGWTVLEADPSGGRCTVGLAALFAPGIVADVTVTIREMEA